MNWLRSYPRASGYSAVIVAVELVLLLPGVHR